MTNEQSKPSSETPEPTPAADKGQGEFHKVDTEVQEEAAKEREESGGYD